MEKAPYITVQYHLIKDFKVDFTTYACADSGLSEKDVVITIVYY